jgi:hypothetical protein
MRGVKLKYDSSQEVVNLYAVSNAPALVRAKSASRMMHIIFNKI